MTDGILAGIRVLDFGRYVAGPYCAALLGDHGADVIRIERESGGEDRYLLPVTEAGDGALFLQMNRNKRSIALDPTSAEGRHVVARLVATADVVVANLPPRTLAAMGLDYESLTAIKPDIILANISAFSADGPWRDRLGFDSVGQAMCGSVYMTGHADQPYRAQANWVDFTTALHAAFGVMLALKQRDLTGLGQEVRADLLSSAITVNNAALIDAALTGAQREPDRNRSFNSAPTDMFATLDGWIVTHVIGQPLFVRWARLMGEEAVWTHDPRFADDTARGLHRAEICERMARWCGERSRDEALTALAAAGVPAGPVLRASETLSHPQVSAPGVMNHVAYPGASAPAPIATPVTLSSQPAQMRRRPPLLGEHTHEILRELSPGP